jgi:hypothetical protein
MCFGRYEFAEHRKRDKYEHVVDFIAHHSHMGYHRYRYLSFFDSQYYRTYRQAESIAPFVG